jgi:DNA-directed RNA polymerase beta' subunit
MNNDNVDVPQALQRSANGRPEKAIRACVKGKEGRLQENLMRNMSIPRHVLLSQVIQIKVPRSIAINLTFSERHGWHLLRKLPDIDRQWSRHTTLLTYKI